MCCLLLQGDRRWTIWGHRSQRVLQWGRCQVGAQPSLLYVGLLFALKWSLSSVVFLSVVFFSLIVHVLPLLLWLCSTLPSPLRLTVLSSYYLLCVVLSCPLFSAPYTACVAVHFCSFSVFYCLLLYLLAFSILLVVFLPLPVFIAILLPPPLSLFFSSLSPLCLLYFSSVLCLFLYIRVLHLSHWHRTTFKTRLRFDHYRFSVPNHTQ